MVGIGLLALLLASLDHRMSTRALKAEYPTSERRLVVPRSRTGILAVLIALLGLVGLVQMLVNN